MTHFWFTVLWTPPFSRSSVRGKAALGAQGFLAEVPPGRIMSSPQQTGTCAIWPPLLPLSQLWFAVMLSNGHINSSWLHRCSASQKIKLGYTDNDDKKTVNNLPKFTTFVKTDQDNFMLNDYLSKTIAGVQSWSKSNWIRAKQTWCTPTNSYSIMF